MRKNPILDRIDWIPVSPGTIWSCIALLVLGGTVAVYYGHSRDPQGTAGPPGPAGRGVEKKVARVVEITGDVKVKKVNQLKWVSAREVSQLEEGDLLQTESGSSARLIFFDESHYEVKPESLISVQRSVENMANQRREVMVEVTSGGVGVATSKKNVESSSFGVQTPNASAVFDEFTVGEAKYDRRMNESQFFVYKGGAEVAARRQPEQPVRLGNAEEVRVDASNQAREKSPLPPSPALQSPKNLGLFVCSNPRQLKVRFAWDAAEGIRQYRLRVSPSSTFRPLLLQKVIPARAYEMEMPDFGPFYWRVDAIDGKGLESPPGPVYSFTVIPKRKDGAAVHDIHIKVDRIIPFGHYFQVVGKTDPGVMVYINDEVVEVKGDGSFKHFTRPYKDKGKHDLVIVGRDLTGLNKTLREKVEVK